MWQEVAPPLTGALVDVVDMPVAPARLVPALDRLASRADKAGWILVGVSARAWVGPAGPLLDEQHFRYAGWGLADLWDLVRLPLERRARHPRRQRTVCPVCAQNVSVSTRTGRAYSHTAPEATEPCPGSGAYVPGVRRDDDVVTVEGPDPGPRHQVPPNVRTGVTEAVSVRAWRGGLPGLGRRR